ncbi:hypothetical protein [Parendozoicomonas haliclonae]|uniref:Uncharacterized protein n=1 Tax=Parendozoicomonas haliclonae TaxID=1960125 RepID=A0A1X7AEJ3_9GAMM|nr:hypothetical protein [Parendozoicomonas haliclonae]SMA32540.1 hypothetical protein EHSB41UT_00161 [Parendozoicomonas haliclonae]
MAVQGAAFEGLFRDKDWRYISVVLISLLLTASDLSMAGGRDSHCTFPPGMYTAHQIGAGFDALTLLVTTSGDFRVIYRVFDNEQASRASGGNISRDSLVYEVWLDRQTASMSCHGDTLEAVYDSPDGYHLDLNLQWNRAHSSLEISGVWIGTSSWPRWALRNGLALAAVGTAGYTGWYLWHHWKDVKAFVRAAKWYAGKQESVIIAGTQYKRPFSELYANLKGDWRAVVPEAFKRYFIQDHLYYLTLPAIGGTLSSLTSFLLDGQSTYPLDGHGLMQESVSNKTECLIPSGYYRGLWGNSRTGALDILLPVRQQGEETWPQITVIEGRHIQKFRTEPWNFECRGNELTLDWEFSEPASKGSIVAYYDKEGRVLLASGVFHRDGWGLLSAVGGSGQDVILENMLLSTKQDADAD